MINYRPSWTEIYPENIQYNCSTVRKLVGDKPRICAVVKANGYGHGAIEAAEACLAAGADFLAVAMMSEALELREAGFSCPVLILGWTPEIAYEAAIEKEIRLAVFHLDEARRLNQVALRLQKKAYVHIKLDTGMSRIGFMPDEVSLSAVAEILAMKGLEAEGIFSHFSKADEKDKTYARKQLSIFQAFHQRLEEMTGYCIPIRHMANSAAIVDLPEAYLDMVRPGIILYGFQPSDQMEHLADVKRALVWKAQVARVQTMPPGTFIGYGGTFETKRDTRVATIPVGYADGYNRLLSNQGYVLYQGKKLPIIGRICMDQFMVDATEAEDIHVGCEVILLGEDGGVSMTVEDMARILKTIPHEIVCGIAPRVPKYYK